MDAGQPRAAQKEHPAGGRNLLLKALAGFAHQRHGLGEDGRHHAADLLRLLLGVALHVDAVDRRDGHLHGEADRVVGPGEPLLALHLLGELGHPPLQLVRVAEEVLPTGHLDHTTAPCLWWRAPGSSSPTRRPALGPPWCWSTGWRP